MNILNAKLCPICGSTEEDESCLKVHLIMTHKANNPEQLLKALQNSGPDAPKLSVIPRIPMSAAKTTKEKKSGAAPVTKTRIAHEGAEGSMIKLGKGNGKGWSSSKLAETIQGTEKKKPVSQESKNSKKDHPKPKTCTESPPSKKGRRTCPVVAMTRVRSTARPHPSASHTVTSAEVTDVSRESCHDKTYRPPLLIQEKEVVVISDVESSIEHSTQDMALVKLKAHPEALIFKKGILKNTKESESVNVTVTVGSAAAENPLVAAETTMDLEKDSVDVKWASLNPPHSPDPEDTVIDYGPQFERVRRPRRDPFPKLYEVAGSKIRTPVAKPVNPKQYWSLLKQMDRATRSCKVWAETQEPMDVFRKAHEQYTKIPGPCLSGVISACYSLKKRATLVREEGPAQGYEDTRMIEYIFTPFETDFRVVSGPILPPAKEKVNDQATKDKEDNSVEP